MAAEQDKRIKDAGRGGRRNDAKTGRGRRRGGNAHGRGGSSDKRIAATPARRLAVEITRDVRQRDAYARELVNARREDAKLPKQEFDYAQVLVFGVVMCRGVLDELIDRNLNSPKDIQPNVRDALRISAYERLFLEKPDHVVVDQGVELVRYVAPKAAGLANAVLRKMMRDAADFPWGDPSDKDAFARKMGVPTWLADTLSNQYGFEVAAKMLATSMEPAPTYTVVNPYAQPARFAADLASQQVASMVPTDGTILEIGAGRGTKTMLLQRNALSFYGEPARIHTVDVHPYKEKLLCQRLDEGHVPGVTTHAGDACCLSDIEGLPGHFDSVLVDAPCSGTGTMRRHPEMRWTLTREKVSEMASLQLELLTEAARRVRVSGTLVYSTCSVLHRENQEVVNAFLKSPAGAAFRIVEAVPVFPEFDGCVTEEGFFASQPVSGGPDGHFAVSLVRQGRGDDA